ncbi:MAG: protein kinase [Acidobacteria bacterium]|nr:protein kinase [Acidobacteriota bacterium]
MKNELLVLLVVFLFIALIFWITAFCLLFFPSLKAPFDLMFGGFPVYGSISARPALYFLGFTLINAVLLYGLYRMFKARTAAAHVPTRELAEYYLHKGKEDKAIAIYAALEMWPEVADLRVKRREYALAVEACNRMGEAGLQRTAELYELMGDANRARVSASETGKFFLNRQDWEKAAKMLFKAGEKDKALLCLEKDIEFSKKSLNPDQWKEKVRRAVEVAAEHNDFNRAGRYCELVADTQSALAYYEKAQNYIRAAQLLIRDERYDEAIDTLDLISPDEPDHAEALALIGKVHFNREMYIDAMKFLVDFFKKTKVCDERLEEFYMMGVTLEKLGKLKQARDVYVRINSMKPYYMNVDMRIEAIDQKGEETASLSEILDKDMEVKDLEAGGEAPLRVGERYGELEELGRGGAGVVYRAMDRLLDRPVALKQLPEAVADDPGRLQAFFKEAKAIAKLNHPNIVGIYDILKVGSFYYLVMEFVKGVSVEKLVAGKCPASIRLSLHIARHTLQALGFAHRNHVVHQDIKPANIMLTDDKIVKLMDFGIASMKDELPDHSVDIVMGTPKYISPEQLQGRPADERSDIYSFGITFYEMLTGVLPYPDEGILRHHLVTPAVPPRVHVREIPEDLETIVLKCLAKKPEERYQSVPELLDDLKDLIRKIETKR